MALTINVFNSGYETINGRPGWDPGAIATWPASTATLIAGERDAILVDALMTFDEGQRRAGWIGETGKNRTDVVIAQGHGDHFFGAGPVLAAFPSARLVALNGTVIEEARANLQPQILQNWTGWFDDRFDPTPRFPNRLDQKPLASTDIRCASLRSVAPTECWARQFTFPNSTRSVPATRCKTTSICGCGTRLRPAAAPGWKPSTRSPI